MRISHYLVLACIFLPIFAKAADNSCLNQFRTNLLSNPILIPAQIASMTGLSPAALSRIAKKDESFSHSSTKSTFNPVTDISYEFSLENSKWSLDITNTISPVEASATDALFSFEQQFQLSDPEGNTLMDITNDFVITKECKQMVNTQSVTNYQRQDESVKITTIAVTAGAAPQKTEVLQSLESARNTAKLSKLKGLKDLKKLGFTLGVKVPVLSDAGQDAFLELKQLPAKPYLNPFSNKTERLTGIAAKMFYGNLVVMEMNAYGMADDSYSIIQTKSSGQSSFEEDISKNSWLNSVLGAAVADNGTPKLVRFKDADFTLSALSYTIASKQKLTFYENAKEYFSVQPVLKKNGHEVLVKSSLMDAPTVIKPWNSTASDMDKKYLKGSRFIQLEMAKPLAEALRPHLKGLNRLQASVVIIRAIDSIIKYDDQGAATDIINTITTEDILKNKTGVCQHYAALFTAVARSLGIPARMVAGYYLQSSGAGAHAWVEVKLNDQTWWPLEPQNASDALLSRSYFPLVQLLSYELPIDHPELSYQYGEAYLKAFKSVNNTVFTSMAP